MNLRRKLAFFMALSRYVEMIVSGIPPLSLSKAKADSLTSVKAYGGLLQSGVPSGYTAVEYIEATGTQYIDTGVKSNSNSKTEVGFTIKGWAGAVFGNYAENNDVGKSNTLYVADSSSKKIYTTDKGSAIGADIDKTLLGVGVLDASYVAIVDWKNKKASLDGVEVSLVSTTVWQGTRNQVLFARTDAYGNVGYFGKFQISYCKIWDDGVLVRDFIPAKRNSDSVIGMFDTVSNTFFTNAGTGTFTAGNEIVPTPSDPVDLVCNNGALKILDKSQWTILTNPSSTPNQGAYIDTSGKWYVVGDRSEGCVIPLTVGKQYTMVIHKKTIPLGTMLRYGQSPQATPTLAGVQLTDWYRGTIQDGIMISFVAKQPYFVMQLNADPTEAGMIQEAIEVLEAQGDNETLAITTKNLCNVATDTDGYYIAEDGTITASANSCYSAVIPVVAGKTYTWSGICGGSSYNNKRVHAYIDGVWNQQVAYEQVTAQTPFTITFTVPAGCNGIRISHFNDDTETQVELGSTKTAYIAYNDSTATANNLFKLNTYQDVQEIITGATTHKCGIRVLDGTEDWTWSSGANAPARLNIPEVDYVLNTDVAPVMCSHFMPTFWNNLSPTTKTTPYVAINQTNQPTAKKIVFTTAWDANITDAESWKTFLATQYAAGTPVIVVYPLATEYAEPAPIAQTMNVVAGDNTLEAIQYGLPNLEAEAIYTKAKY